MGFNKQQQWICGRSAEGKACRSGADNAGQCQSRAECHPIKKGERWYCSRSTPCQDGALPDGECSQQTGFCLPKLSQKAKISRFNLWLLVLSFGILFLMLASSSYSPGQLSLSHRFLDENCEGCHSTGESDALAVLYQAFQPHPHKKENALCVDCHQFGEYAAAPHTLPPKELELLTKKAQQHNQLSTLFMATVAKNSLSKDEDLSCINCHREHQGLKHDLTAINDKSCQSCHQETFLAFKNHPEFTDYPYAPYTNIKFEHQQHVRKNFTEEEDLKQFKPENCNDCHEPDNKGQLMLVKGFDKACSNCHLPQIQGNTQTGAKGIAVFNLIGMDVETLRDKGFVTGSWDENADSELSVFMHLLLSNDEKATKAIAVLDKVDTLDLRKATQIQLQAATDLIWSIKRLFFSLQQQGQEGLKAQLETLLKIDLPPKQFAELSSLLPPDLFNQALNDWLPLLSEELKLYQQQDYVALKELLAPKPEIKSAEILKPKPKVAESDDLLSGGDDLLAADDDLLGGDDDLLSGNEDLEEEESDSSSNHSKVVSAEEWVSSGGWYRSYDSLYYRPSQHADKFLKSWLNLTVASKNRHLQAIFKVIGTPKSQGMCLKCHSISDTQELNWYTKRPEKNKQDFTRYAHDRHLAMAEIKDCATCHQFRVHKLTEDGERIPESCFKPIEKSQCAECHSETGIASESCTTCHNYHVGDINLKLKKTELSVFEKVKE